MDIQDIHSLGSKSSVGRVRKKGGDYNPYNKPGKKAAVRRYWARRARTEAKHLVKDAL